MIKRRNGAIPRKPIPARRLIEVKNDFNEVIDTTIQTFTALNCTVQPIEGSSMTPDLVGFMDREVFTVFTETLLIAGVEGGLRKPDELFIYNKWFKVIRCKRWQVGLAPHYECIVVEKDEGLL